MIRRGADSSLENKINSSTGQGARVGKGQNVSKIDREVANGTVRLASRGFQPMLGRPHASE